MNHRVHLRFTDVRCSYGRQPSRLQSNPSGVACLPVGSYRIVASASTIVQQDSAYVRENNPSFVAKLSDVSLLLSKHVDRWLTSKLVDL